MLIRENFVITTIIATIYFDDWEAEMCYQTKSADIILNKNDVLIKVAVIYQAVSLGLFANETIISQLLAKKIILN